MSKPELKRATVMNTLRTLRLALALLIGLSVAPGAFADDIDIFLGLAMLTPNSAGGSTGGGYIRFGARDMTVASNRTALQNILANIVPCVGGCGSANESLSGMSHKDETAALYELYKYFSGLAPYT